MLVSKDVMAALRPTDSSSVIGCFTFLELYVLKTTGATSACVAMETGVPSHSLPF